ncbi:sporulation protein YqfD [Fictibacillus sp. 5RED26]|uniref:sporulation protein YqfD n=1 Tax=unclassified Fictibacillus TaxID=2644029 RepID=UPI0018CEF981|nr:MULTISPECIES: sporulation protein YqfD [unclassified Fictibacillus]MBH0158499.1 sporulation protein YqfD [Fictibacillus sp. 5RED26]MBH0174644.1 sporulation protein YqfD [Fictibacillus sp. 23RED33]
MKTKWNHLKGYVRVEIIGQDSSSFINTCIQSGISIWDIQPLDNNRALVSISVTDVQKARGILKENKLKIRIKEKKGTPFLLKRMWKRNGFILGMLSFIFLLFLLSNMIWNINVTGANPKTEYELRKAAVELGVTKGKFIFLLPNVREIQRDLTEKMDNVTWIGVTQHGTSYRFEVVEKEIPEAKQVTGPRHLVATKEAVIHSVFVEKGQPIVGVNDYVKKGSLLVSGLIGKEKKPQLVSAKGEIWGEVWYQTEVEVPLNTSFQTYTGKYKNRHYVSLFGLNVPVYGFSEGEFKDKTETLNESPLYLAKWKMPFSYIKKEFRETDGVKRSYSKAEAIEVGKKMAKKELSKKLPEDAKINGEKVWQQNVSNGKVKLTMLYQVIENIASAQPIPIQQGE